MSVFVQTERRGTAHAALHARTALAAAADDVVVGFGDTPLVRPETFAALRAPLAAGAAVVVGAFRAADPTGYGRVLTVGGAPVAIREHRDATAQERAIDLVNGGLMAFAADTLLDLLDAIRDDNAKREFYITDAIALARAKGLSTALVEIPAEDVAGVNDRAQLAAVEAIAQRRLRHAALEAGVGMIAPDTVFLSWDTRLAEDVLLHPHVVVRPGVTLERGVEVLSFSHLEGARVRAGARIGPFARLRPKSDVGEGAHIGNFVEINRSTMGPGAEANHLAYVGDATVGAGTNIGAGTITCNFDGADKHPTVIGPRRLRRLERDPRRTDHHRRRGVDRGRLDADEGRARRRARVRPRASGGAAGQGREPHPRQQGEARRAQGPRRLSAPR